jgi:predicted phosphodiesterase
MFCFAKSRFKAALTRLHNISSGIRANKKVLTKGGFRFFVFLFAIAMGMLLISPQEFPVHQGSLSYQLTAGSWSGGYVRFSLGPLGSVNFHTHAVPINIKMNLVLNNDITTGQDIPKTISSNAKKFMFDAVSAFEIFLLFRVLIVVTIGLAAGVMLSNGGKHWFKRRFVMWGMISFLAIAGVLIGISYLTLNRSPDISYTGPLTQDMARAAPYVLKVAGDYQLKEGLLNSFIDGAIMLNSQMDNQASGNQGIAASGTHILLASDVHDSIAGMQIASQIINDPKKRFGDISALILAGDITNAGYSWESHLFKDSLNIGKVPVYFVGGNHENASAMHAFTQMGYKLLTSKEVSINGVTIIGQSDPTAYTSSLVSTPKQLLDDSGALDKIWYNYANLPDLVVVHEFAQAQDVISTAEKHRLNLTIVYGHDHMVGHKTEDTVQLVDCGTAGASNLDGVSRGVSYTFQILNFSSGPHPKLVGIWTLEFDRLDRGGSQHYYPIK